MRPTIEIFCVPDKDEEFDFEAARSKRLLAVVRDRRLSHVAVGVMSDLLINNPHRFTPEWLLWSFKFTGKAATMGALVELSETGYLKLFAPGHESWTSQVWSRYPETLYRFYSSGELLYVGVTNNLPGRLQNHTHQEWWDEVTNVRLRFFSSRQSVEDAEMRAINREYPTFNVRGAAWLNQPLRTGPVDPSAIGDHLTVDELAAEMRADGAAFGSIKAMKERRSRRR